jgi:hypothetical protein
MWFRVISKSLSYSTCLIDISIYPNNLFVKLVSESFYMPVELATRIIPLKFNCPQQDPLKKVQHILVHKHQAYSITYGELHKRILRVCRLLTPHSVNTLFKVNAKYCIYTIDSLFCVCAANRPRLPGNSAVCIM